MKRWYVAMWGQRAEMWLRVLVLWMVAACHPARAGVVVIERGVPELPKMQPALRAAVVMAAWEKRSLPEVMDALQQAQKAGRIAEVVAARDWLAMHRQKDGDLWEAACAQAKWGDAEIAMRWLQEAARRESCDVSDVEGDEDFAAVVKHGQWAEVRKDLRACAASWRASSYSRIVLTLPEKHEVGKALPFVVGMHGYGSLPEDFRGDDMQKMCDRLGVAVLAVSGRGVMARNSFEWSGDTAADMVHVLSCMDAVKAHAVATPGAGVLIGFSQGGQMALQMLASHPQHFRGAMAMSPGSRHAAALRKTFANEKSQVMAGKTVFFSWIAGEGASMARRCGEDAEWYRGHGAKAVLQEFPGAGHSWPRGYAEYFSLALQVMR